MTSLPVPTPRRLIVGCGYLGERLAARWVASGSRVWGLVRTPGRVERLSSTGVEAIIADVASGASLPPLPEVDTVVWSVGFDRSAGHGYRDVHVGGLSRLLEALPGRPRVIFVSSTGVWGRLDGLAVDEATPPHPDREAGRVLLEAEALLRGHRLGPGTALRLAGIYGPGRLPRLDDLRSGAALAADPDSWLNLIHVDDAAAVVMAVADHAGPGPLYVVSDGHPVRRREFYARLASLTGSPPPRWTPPSPDARGGDKQVDPRRLYAEIGPALAHPNALAALAEIPGMLSSGSDSLSQRPPPASPR
jgi:nucleoside-diphosphate-sugar epimerase